MLVYPMNGNFHATHVIEIRKRKNNFVLDMMSSPVAESAHFWQLPHVIHGPA
jgi:hypothetical protein